MKKKVNKGKTNGTPPKECTFRDLGFSSAEPVDPVLEPEAQDGTLKKKSKTYREQRSENVWEIKTKQKGTEVSLRSKNAMLGHASPKSGLVDL